MPRVSDHNKDAGPLLTEILKPAVPITPGYQYGRWNPLNGVSGLRPTRFVRAAAFVCVDDNTDYWAQHRHLQRQKGRESGQWLRGAEDD